MSDAVIRLNGITKVFLTDEVETHALADIDLAIRTHTVLCLAEMSERLSLTLLFDEKSRAIKTGDGRTIVPISYESIVPMST